MDNPLKNLFSKLDFLQDRSGGGSAIGIDIGSSSIKVVEIKKKGSHAVLETYGAISLGPYAGVEVGRPTNLPTDKIVEALKEVLKQSGITANSTALALPVQSSLIFTIDLPAAVKESELPVVVPTEARKYVPIAISEVSIDYFVLPKKELSYEESNNPDLPSALTAKTEVLVIVLQNDTVSKYQSIVSEAALSASFFEIEIFSSIRANFEHELSLVLLMDIGASFTKLSLVEFGMVKNYHTIKRGGADITDSISKSLSIPFAEAETLKKEFGLFDNPAQPELASIIGVHLDYIFAETNSVLAAHQKKYQRTASKVILTGGGALLKGLKESAVNNLRTEVEVGRPFSKVDAPVFLEKVLDVLGPEFGVALGLALRKLE